MSWRSSSERTTSSWAPVLNLNHWAGQSEIRHERSQGGYFSKLQLREGEAGEANELTVEQLEESES